jgi:hypothetical protein
LPPPPPPPPTYLCTYVRRPMTTFDKVTTTMHAGLKEKVIAYCETCTAASAVVTLKIRVAKTKHLEAVNPFLFVQSEIKLS